MRAIIARNPNRVSIPERVRKMSLSVCLIAASLFSAQTIKAQSNVNWLTNGVYEEITFAEYLQLVVQNNLGFLAAQFDVSIAEAEARAERVFHDPELTITFYENDYGAVLFGRGIELELEWEVELGGERRSRIRLAQSEAQMQRILLDAALAELRAEAATAFLEAQKQLRMLELRQSMLDTMREVHRHDSISFALGEIPEMEFLQTRLEVRMLRNELIEQEAEVRMAMAALNEMASRDPRGLLRPATPLSRPIQRDFTLVELFDIALDDNVDLAVVMQEKQITRNELRLARAERIPNIGLSLVYEIREASGDWGTFHAVAFGVTIPLMFSNANRGGLRAAQLAVEQAEIEYRATIIEVKSEIAQAFFEFEALQNRVNNYEDGMLDDAQRIVDAALTHRRRGDLRLIEVLDAIETLNELLESYIETLFEYGTSAVELQRVSGIWEIDF